MSGVPSNFVIPFVGVEFDNTLAGSPSALNHQVFGFGQKLSTGSGASGVIYKVGSADEVGDLAGWGSMAHIVAMGYFAVNNTQSFYMYFLDDAVGTTKAAYSITITASSVEAGELALMIDGTRIAVPVAAGATATEIGDAIVTAITAQLDYLPVENLVNTAGVVTFDAKNGGTIANGLDVRVNHYDGEKLPVGVTFAFALDSAGAGDPSLTDMITATGEVWYQTWVSAYTDATNLEAIETELDSRFGVVRQNDGQYITAKKDTQANMLTYAATSGRNNPHVTTFDGYKYPQSVSYMAGVQAGVIARKVADDPGEPLHREPLPTLIPPRKEDRSKIVDRNTLALAGIATMSPDNGVQIEACVTMYTKNLAGATDTSYQQTNSMYILQFLRYDFRNEVLSKYGQARLADTAERIRAGIQVITPDIGRALAIDWFLRNERAGLVEGLAQFKEQIQCYRDPNNKNRLVWLLPPDLINAFIVGSATMQFRQ